MCVSGDGMNMVSYKTYDIKILPKITNICCVCVCDVRRFRSYYISPQTHREIGNLTAENGGMRILINPGNCMNFAEKSLYMVEQHLN